MVQVRIHGRGGQGVVTAAEMLSVAAFHDGLWSQAIPSFGSERTGAPVVAFCRIDHREIRTREPVLEPDAVIVQDPTLLHQVDVFAGLTDHGYVLVNSTRRFEELDAGTLVGRLRGDHLLTVPATELARVNLGQPLPNAALLGGLVAISGIVSLPSLLTAIRRRFTGAAADGNAAAARAAHAFVGREMEARAHA